MPIIPEQFLNILREDKNFYKSILDIEFKIDEIVNNQSPIFFSQYTDHGINHFRDTLKMALHLVSLDESDKLKDKKAVIEHFTPINVFVLTSAILFHDIGMHIHFNGFKQLIAGFFDDVRVDFFNELTWKQEWDNFMIEAKRFSGRERINLFGDEQAIIKDIDFTKLSVDSDNQKNLIGEFIRRHHGRLAHEIALKGFPVKDNETFQFANDLKREYKDIIGLIARSHSMNIRDAMSYIEEIFPADPHFPYEIEVPFLMCILRVSDYFQIDNSRTNAFLVKLKSFTSPFSLKEHQAHLATEYFKTDEKDPETLFVDAKPKDGLMFAKLIRLFDDIQRELDTSFAIIGEMYGRNRSYFKLRYRRIKSNLRNRKVIGRFPYIPDVYKFEADTDLFKLLVGPLYGYDASFGVREMIQNAVDACIELQFKADNSYTPNIQINIDKVDDGQYSFTITDNGKGMSLGEIKSYFLKAGASFRNSTEWKIDYQSDENIPAIRRTGKFGIGVLASFLVGDTIEVTTKRYNEHSGYTFIADLKNEFIEVRKNKDCKVGTTIAIKMHENNYTEFRNNPEKITKWYVLSSPMLYYYINKVPINIDSSKSIEIIEGNQSFENAIKLEHDSFDDIIWTYNINEDLAINGIVIPSPYYYPTPKVYGKDNNEKTIYDELKVFPFVSIIDRNNQIDLELNRNSIRGHLPFMKELVDSCKLDFLYNLLFFEAPIENKILDLSQCKTPYENGEYEMEVNAPQFGRQKIYVTTEGYFLNNTFYAPTIKNLDYYKIFTTDYSRNKIELLQNSVCSLTTFFGVNGERNIIRGDYHQYIAVSDPYIYLNNYESKAITKFVRDRIDILEQNQDYIIFSTRDYKSDKKSELIKLLELNNADAVQLVDKSLFQDEEVNKLLKKHFGKPQLIPHDWEKKKEYAKNLSEELRRYIEHKRGIKL